MGGKERGSERARAGDRLRSYRKRRQDCIILFLNIESYHILQWFVMRNGKSRIDAFAGQPLLNAINSFKHLNCLLSTAWMKPESPRVSVL